MSEPTESEKAVTEKRISEDDIVACWPHAAAYMVDILNGEYAAQDAREDLLSLIGTEFDPRTMRSPGRAKDMERSGG